MITIEKLQEIIRSRRPLATDVEKPSGAIHIRAEEHLDGRLFDYGTSHQIVYDCADNVVWEVHCDGWRVQDLDGAYRFAMEWMLTNIEDTVVVIAETHEIYWRRTQNLAFIDDDDLCEDENENCDYDYEKETRLERFEEFIHSAMHDGLDFFRRAQKVLGRIDRQP